MNSLDKDIIPLSILQSFLNQNEIPVILEKTRTFLDITKQPHYENVISNIYAFFLNIEEIHGLNDLFIRSLQELISEYKNEPYRGFKDFEVITEYGTINQKRIDILLQNNEQAIIIENKIYHFLNNDLNEYFNEIKVVKKVGIILSLNPISDIGHSAFINITHAIYLKRVMYNLGKYMLHANDKYLVFLKDFYQNILNLSQPIMERKNISFYYNNQPKIIQILELEKQLKNHIKSEVEKAGEMLEGVNKYSPKINSNHDNVLVYYFSPHNRSLMITVVFDKLLTAKRLMHIAVELQDQLLNDRSVYNQIEFSSEEKEIAFAEHFRTTNESWSHFAVKEYQPTDDEIENLSQFILDKLEQDHLLSIFRKLERFIQQEKGQSNMK